MALETSVKLLLASFSVVSLEERCNKEPGKKVGLRHQPSLWDVGQRPRGPPEFHPSTLTDLIHRDVEGLQFGAASQEAWRNLLQVVLAHVEQLDLREAQRDTKLGYTVPGKR